VKREGLYGVLAEYDSVAALQRAATALLIRGYRHVRIYAPYSVKEVAGLFASPVAKIKTGLISPVVFAGGAGGAAVAFFVQWYANVIDDPLNVGGRPYNSWPSFIPITFELAVLGAALAAAVAFLILNSLPQFHHPLFNSDRFERATQDRFFICVEERDGKFDRKKTPELLRDDALHVEEVWW
jgi:ActD protein